MTIRAKPPAEVAIDASLIRTLLQEQHADVSHLALVDIGEGWDNRLFRLGDDLAVRIPRRAVAAGLIEQEQRWLPLLAPRLPLPIPVPLRIGRPSGGFPWSGPLMWIHGDLHPGNLLVSGGRLSAVIDFGDLAAGDPATDLSVLWMLPSRERSSLLASARGALDTLDDDTLMRARGWALALGLAYLAQSRGDESMASLGRATIDAALKHDAPRAGAS